MSRGKSSLVRRGLAVWMVVTATAITAAALTPGVWQAARSSSGPTAFSDVLVASCAASLLLALTWLWLVTTVTVGELVTGRARSGGGVTRRIVLVACGAAVLAGSASPALAAGDGSRVLAGLPLPDRSVTSPVPDRAAPAQQAVVARPTTATGHHVVRPGDSLWSIAEAEPGSAGDVERRWRAIWAANRDVVGDDPDLIIPGQRLRLPEPGPSQPGPSQPTDEGAR